MNYKSKTFRGGLSRRLSAMILAVCMVLTMSPPFTSAAGVTDRGEIVLLSGFEQLPNEVAVQNVAIGVASVDLVLPDTLEAYLAVQNSGNGEEVPLAESEPEETENSEPDNGTPLESSSAPESIPSESSPVPESASDELQQSESSEPTMGGYASEEAEAVPMESAGTEEAFNVNEPAANETATRVFSAYALDSGTQPALPVPMTPDGDVTTSAAVIVKDIVWKSAPAFDGNVAGTYTFTAVLSAGYVVEEGVSLPQIEVTVGKRQLALDKLIAMIDALPNPADALLTLASSQQADIEAAEEIRTALREEERSLLPSLQSEKLDALLHILVTEYDCLDYGCQVHYAPERMEAVMQQLDTRLLTLEDIVREHGITPPVIKGRSAPNPQSIGVFYDNEDNAHTGKADKIGYRFFSRGGDFTPLNFQEAQAPVEARFDVNSLPTQSAYLVIDAYDVDVSAGEIVEVYFNDVKLGQLRGINLLIEQTVLQVPLQLITPGKNYVTVKLCEAVDAKGKAKYTTYVLTMQLVLDGGKSRQGGSPKIKLDFGEPTSNGMYSQLPMTVNVTGNTSSKSLRYSVELRSSSDFAFLKYIASSGGEFTDENFSEEKSGSIHKSISPGYYTAVAILYDETDFYSPGEVVSMDTASFYIDDNKRIVIGPIYESAFSPSTPINGSVGITSTLKNAMGCTDISIENNGAKTVTENGDYTFIVNYKRGGVARTINHTAKVSNIDKIPPGINYTPFTVQEDMANAEIETLLRGALKTTDNFYFPVTISFNLIKDLAGSIGSKTVAVTASDAAGNQTSQNCEINVLPQALAMTQSTPMRVGSSSSFTLSAVLKNAGGEPITETGFVWGSMQNPTTAIYNGKAATTPVVAQKGGAITLVADHIVDGVTYYSRPYAIANGKTYYGEQKTFTIGGKSYGLFSISNNADNIFTITRTDGVDDAQTVYYRTVNGSAVGGTHFTHATGTVTFNQGETVKTIAVAGENVNATFGSNSATAFSNADRTYQMEIYRVVGGGNISASSNRATRTLTGGKGINAAIYTTEVMKDTDRGSWVINDTNANGVPLVTARSSSVNKSFSHQPKAQFTGDTATYLAATDAGYLYRYLLTEMLETDDGWEHTWVGTAPANDVVVNQSNGGNPIPLSSTAGTALYTASFELWFKNKFFNFKFPQEGAEKTIPSDGGAGVGTPYKHLGTITTVGSEKYIKVDEDDTLYVHFGACGANQDNWEFYGINHYVMPIDEKEPQILGVAPMAGGIYKSGDPVIVSIVFDEIVTAAPGVSLETNFGQMSYAGGIGTNVLYFSGQVPSGVSSGITVSKLNNAEAVKDISSTVGTTCTDKSGSANASVDTTLPTITITNAALANGTATATINAVNADTLQYAWTNSSTMPVNGWFSCTAGTVAKTRQTQGKWYLHVLAAYGTTGSTNYASKEFDFGTPENPISPLPALTVSADNTSWAHSRSITVARTPDEANVTYTGPQNGTVSGGTVNVTANGLYIFTLTSGDETVVESVSVSKLDAAPPTLTLREPGGAGAVYNTIVFAADVADNLSGVAKVEYAVTGTSNVPAGGWASLSGSGSSYNGSYTETAADTKTTKYIHVRVTDNAGNVTTKTSAAYTVVKENAAAAPAITLTGAPTSWTNGPVSLTWAVTNPGAGDYTVYLDGSNSTETTGTLPVYSNGLRMVRVVDQNGNTAEASLSIQWIDAEAPTLSKLTSSAGWGASKTVTLIGVTDDNSPITDAATGLTTGYGGSGMAKQEWKLGNGSYTAFTGNSFTVTADGTYTVRLTDNVGNQNEYETLVSQLDATAPAVTVGTPATDWTCTVQSISVTYSDSQSGIDTAQYKIVSDTETKPEAGLTNLPVSGGTVIVSTSGVNYIYYKVTDKAGNVTDGYSAVIKVDTAAPVIGTLTYSEEPANLWQWIIGKTSLIITVPVTESGSGADKISYTMTPSSGSAVSKTANISGGNAEIAFDEAFKGTVVISCTDKAGNQSATVSVGKNGVIVENYAPTITIAERNSKVPNSDGWYNTEINLIANVKDDGVSGGLAWVEKKIDNGAVTKFTSGVGSDGRRYDFATSLTTTFPDYFTTGFLYNGEHTAYFRAADNAGNVSEWMSFAYKKDANKPTINTPSLSESGYTAEDITVSVDITDNWEGSGIKSVTVVGAVGGTMTLTKQDNTYQFTTTQNDTFTITATDYAGNVETSEYKVFNIDKTSPKAPTIAITGGTEGSNGWYIESVTFAVTKGDNSDVPSGTTSFAYSIDSGATWSSWQPFSGGSTFAIETDGDYTGKIVAKTRSNAGAVSPASAPTGVKIDRQTPMLTIAGGEIGSAQFDFAIGSDFGPSGGVITVSKDGEAAQTVTEGKYTVTETGKYIINATSGSGLEDETNRWVFAVGFDSKGGSAVAAQLVAENGQAAEPTKPKKAGYAFKEWRKAGESVPYNFDSDVTDNVSLQAVWELGAPSVHLAVDNASPTYNGDTAATLTASPTHASAGATYAYEWYKGSTKIDGQTGSTLELQTVADSGNYTVRVTASGDGITSPQAESNAVTVTIAKAPVSFGVSDNTHDYDGNPKTANVAQTAGETPDVTGKFTISYEKDGSPVTNPTSMGIYTVLVELTDANFKHKSKTDSAVKTQVGTLTINGIEYPDADTMTWPTAADIFYGKKLSDSVLTGGDQAAKGTYTWTTSDIVPTVQNDGYWVMFTPADGNYAPVEKIINIKVAKATPTLKLPTAAGITYGETLEDSSLTGGSASTTYNGTANTNVPGKYKWITPAAKPAVSDSGSTEYGMTFTPDDTDNYNMVTTGKVKLTVAQREVILRWSGHTGLTYTGRPVAVSAAVSNLVEADSCAVTVAEGTKTNAGDYTAMATALDNGNYKLPADVKQAYTIAKKPVKVLWSDLFPTYDGTAKSPTIALDGVLNSEDCTVVSTGSAAEGNVGRYKVSAALQGTSSGNYTMQNPGEILVIQPAPVIISLSDYSYKYDGAAKYATVTATPDVPITVTYKLAGNEVAAPIEEGIYDILVGINGKNYRFEEGTDGKSRRMGALTIYKEKPPELYTITFAPGAQDAAGTAPMLPAAVKDTVHILPSNSFLRAGHAFVGWKNGNTLYQPGERFVQPANNGTVFTAQWESATYDIGGVVDQDGKPIANVRVVLMRGAEQVAETVTNQIGEYHFDNVLPGLYNLVASKPSPDGVGDIIMTIMVEVKAADVEQANITLPNGKTNSIVEVAPGTPKIIVGNLDQTFKNTEGNVFTPEDKAVVNKGGTVEIKFIAEEKQKSDIIGDAGKISKEAGHTKIGLYLALDVEKTVTQPADPSTPDVEPPSDTTPIPKTSVLLESVIPLPSDLQGKQSYTVYRVHEGSVDSLTTGADSGERIEISADKTTLILHAQKFSTYAIAYTEKSIDAGSSSGGNTGGTKTDSIQPGITVPVAPVTPVPTPDVPDNVANPTRPGTTTPDASDTDDADEEVYGEDTEYNPDRSNMDAQKDRILAALENAIKNLPDTLTDEQRQAVIKELNRITDNAIAALNSTNDPKEAERIAVQACGDMEKLVAEALALVGGSEEKPFVILSALLAMVSVLLAVFALLKRQNRRRKLLSSIFAVLAVTAFLLTNGWSGFTLANWWTLAVSAFSIGAAMGVFARHSKQEEQP